MHKFFAKTLFLGKKVYSLPQCHSTNEEAQKLISQEKTIEGLVIIAESQTKGKGQRGNNWESQPGKNLTCSIVLRPSFLKISDQFGLHVICSLAIEEALYPILGNKLRIKWPNDIYYRDNKLAGILIENTLRGSSIEHSILGIGLNINQTEFQTDHATSLAEICMKDFDVNEMAENILIKLERRYLQLKNGHKKQLHADYHSRLYRYKEECFFKDSNSRFIGRIHGVSEMGKLLIEANDQVLSYEFKEVEFLRNEQ